MLRAGGHDAVSAPPELAPALGAVCDLLARCPDLPPIASRSRGECIDIVYWLATCRLEGSTGVVRRQLPLDGPAVAACAAFLDGLSCDEHSCLSDGSCPEGAACAGLFSGLDDDDESGADTAGPGESCSRYGAPACDSDHYCAAEAYDEAHAAMLCSVCVPRLTVGEICEWGGPQSDCASGLVCAWDTSGVPTARPASRFAKTVWRAVEITSARADSVAATSACTEATRVTRALRTTSAARRTT